MVDTGTGAFSALFSMNEASLLKEMCVQPSTEETETSDSITKLRKEIGEPPATGNWEWREGEPRVYVFNASKYTSEKNQRPKNLFGTEDGDFYNKLLFRDDILVVGKGFFNPEHEEQWTFQHLFGKCADDKIHTRYRIFECANKDPGKYQEAPNKKLAFDEESDPSVACMEGAEFAKYMEALIADAENNDNDSTHKHEIKVYKYDQTKGTRKLKTVEIDLRKTSFYATDYRLRECAPELFPEYLDNFLLTRTHLSGGKLTLSQYSPDMMRALDDTGMLYVGYGGGTAFHMDGMGSLDAIHHSIRGFHYVICLRRLDDSEIRLFDFEFLGEEESKSWPDVAMIEELRRQGFIPICCVLRAGEVLAITKRRLHTFQKATEHILHESHSHFKLQQIYRKSNVMSDKRGDYMCLSVAHDSNFLGGNANEMQQNAIMASVSAEDLTHLKPQTGKTKPLSRLDIFHTAMAIKNGRAPHLTDDYRRACSSPLKMLMIQLEEEFRVADDFVRKGWANVSLNVPVTLYVKAGDLKYPLFCHVDGCKKELVNAYIDDALSAATPLCLDCFSKQKSSNEAPDQAPNGAPNEAPDVLPVLEFYWYGPEQGIGPLQKLFEWADEETSAAMDVSEEETSAAMDVSS